MSPTVVTAVLEDWRSAPIDDRLKAALGYLERLTLHPDALTSADIVELNEAGVSDEAATEIAYVALLFSVMDRLADTFDFDIPSTDEISKTGQFLHKRGYKLVKMIR
jgi:alkylhydroperoxidase family enzyme